MIIILPQGAYQLFITYQYLLYVTTILQCNTCNNIKKYFIVWNTNSWVVNRFVYLQCFTFVVINRQIFRRIYFFIKIL